MACNSNIALVVSEPPAVSLAVSSVAEAAIAVQGVVEVVTSRTQEKAVTPSADPQVVTPDEGYLLSSVTVGAIPENYGLITWDGATLTVS